jgi:DNA/RNA-binding domain of Phe-tRNA-synthetase-like protein
MQLSGSQQDMQQGDMMFTDDKGIISSIVYGPDQRTRITPGTRHALFTIYGTPGITADAIRQHLRDIERYARVIAPDAETEVLDVYCGD